MSYPVYLGDDLDILFEAKDSRGKPLDLSGAVLYCDAQSTLFGAPLVEASGFAIDDGPAGLCRARFTSQQTSAFGVGAIYVYDGRVKTSDGKVHTIGTGSFRALAPRTPTPA